MSERHAVASIFKTAIELGREEQRLYAEAELCEDDSLRKVLESFSSEAGHQHFLLEK
jgi:hypothetical protein